MPHFFISTFAWYTEIPSFLGHASVQSEFWLIFNIMLIIATAYEIFYILKVIQPNMLSFLLFTYVPYTVVLLWSPEERKENIWHHVRWLWQWPLFWWACEKQQDYIIQNDLQIYVLLALQLMLTVYCKNCRGGCFNNVQSSKLYTVALRLLARLSTLTPIYLIVIWCILGWPGREDVRICLFTCGDLPAEECCLHVVCLDTAKE